MGSLKSAAAYAVSYGCQAFAKHVPVALTVRQAGATAVLEMSHGRSWLLCAVLGSIINSVLTLLMLIDVSSLQLQMA
jgi:hypothetical protein